MPGAWTDPVNALSAEHALPLPDWTFQISKYNSTSGFSESIRLTHTPSGLTVIGGPYGARFVEFCPARMIRANNVLLPVDGDEYDKALSNAQQITKTVAWFPDKQEPDITRLDLCVYVSLPVEQLIRLFGSVKAPGIHKCPTPQKHKTGLHWKGDPKSLLMYDKAVEQGSQLTEDRTRIELQLHNEAISRTLGFKSGGRLTKVSVHQCYTALRNYLLSFPFAQIGPKYRETALIAHAMAQGLKAPDGGCLLEWRLSDTPTRKQRNVVRRQIEAAMLGCTPFRWEDYLPENPTLDQWRSLCGYPPKPTC